ncbi:aminotransferase class I/II-fold pyridoxal phosphate-dependent enzyme [Simiduia curdlanivorans]|uniref:Pyridoxal phosphate-dependent aminotransferase n=1 Tax=Simiduia curdlanivorans TaxID=1492769 RepID=A0ABV8V894_9GAMM|nr:aminotransferase class I/II-fold pyridoxal phosphate-dependent enzyme [Simiduia curdlanivorans]MDN3639549.1 aminotransferase class I/II-fold pyridoxal phosphate-dependent enzyme [Simiduia curdlanivorans]
MPITQLKQQPISVTRQMAAALPKLAAIAKAKGLELHHLGAGYPHPEVTNPMGYIAHKDAYFEHLAGQEPLQKVLQPLYSYTDTLGPASTREMFAKIYGHDFNTRLDPELLIPTIGSSGGISQMCSLFERSGEKVAYITDAPTYAGFISRANLYQKARIYSVEMDLEGPSCEALAAQITQARADGYTVAFYYTVPDGHNPGGISFSEQRRRDVIEVLRAHDTLLVEDAPYSYISFETANKRPKPFFALAPEQTVHLFTASKIGLPGPRIGFMYTEAKIELANKQTVPLNQLLLTEASANILLHNPEALRGFEAFLTDEKFSARQSLWPIANEKNQIYSENRQILLDTFEQEFARHKDMFHWTKPGAGFFSVFTINHPNVICNSDLTDKLVAEYGVVTIPTFSFYPEDARARNSKAGLDQLRLSFCYSEGIGERRRQQLQAAASAFAEAIKQECGV